LPSLVAAAVANRSYQTSAIGLLPSFTASGIGRKVLVVNGIGIGLLPQFEGHGIGVKSGTALGAGLLPMVTGFGAGTMGRTGVGAGLLAQLLGAGAGHLERTSVGAGGLAALTSAGVGIRNVTQTGSGAGDLPSLTASGVGTLELRVAKTLSYRSLDYSLSFMTIGLNDIPSGMTWDITDYTTGAIEDAGGACTRRSSLYYPSETPYQQSSYTPSPVTTPIYYWDVGNDALERDVGVLAPEDMFKTNFYYNGTLVAYFWHSLNNLGWVII
jgi:hypothetical protein